MRPLVPDWTHKKSLQVLAVITFLKYKYSTYLIMDETFENIRRIILFFKSGDRQVL